jgi:hypothetical protein
MHVRIRRCLSVRNALATLALAGALGGTSYAASQLPHDSVGARQMRAGAVTSAKVRDGSLRSADLNASARGADGPRGPLGTKGPRGDKGATGSLGVVVRTLTPAAPLAGGATAGVGQACLPGERAVGGGVGFSPAAGERTGQSFPTVNGASATDGGVPTGWSALVKNAGTTPVTPTGYVLCAH